MTNTSPPVVSPSKQDAASAVEDEAQPSKRPGKPEHGGPKGPEPTRYGDWERNGRCFDF